MQACSVFCCSSKQERWSMVSLFQLHNYAPRVLDAKIVVWLRLLVSTTSYIHAGMQLLLQTREMLRGVTPLASTARLSDTEREDNDTAPAGCVEYFCIIMTVCSVSDYSLKPGSSFHVFARFTRPHYDSLTSLIRPSAVSDGLEQVKVDFRRPMRTRNWHSPR